MHHKKGGRLPERGGRVLGVWAGEAKVTGDEDPVEDVLDRIEAHDLRNDVVGLINICARSFPLPSTPSQPSQSALQLEAWSLESTAEGKLTIPRILYLSSYDLIRFHHFDSHLICGFI